MRTLITLTLVLTGCTLVVGTDPRTVAEAGTTEAGTTDAGADVNPATCKNDCQSAYLSCTAACPHGGPQQKPCDDACTSTQHDCNDQCP